MPDLLLEFFSEEIPARMQARAADDLKKLVTDRLVEAGLVYEGAKAFATPRRLALTVQGVPARSPTSGKRRRARGSARPRRAIAGFLRAAGLTSIDQAKVQADKKGDFYVAVIEKPGRPAIEVIAEIVPRCRARLPVAEVDALGRCVGQGGRAQLGAAAAFDRRDLRAGDRGARGRDVRRRRHRRGRRDARPPLHGAGADQACAASTTTWRSSRSAKVVLDPERRKEIILADAKNLAFAQGYELVEDAGPAWRKSPVWWNGRWC